MERANRLSPPRRHSRLVGRHTERTVNRNDSEPTPRYDGLVKEPTRAALTRVAAKAFVRRWDAVARMQRRLRASQSDEDRLRDLAILMESARRMGWEEGLDREDVEVRDRWNRLRSLVA